MPEPEKFDRVPPVTVTSPATKSVAVSESVKVMVAVSPAFSAVALLETTMVGRTVSTVKVAVLSASAPSLLRLPAASVNLSFATLTTPLVVLASVGVNTAV